MLGLKFNHLSKRGPVMVVMEKFMSNSNWRIIHISNIFGNYWSRYGSLSIVAIPTTKAVLIGISDIHYATVTRTIREQMNVCAQLSPPVPIDIDIERPCPTGAMGRYIYVVQVLESASKGNMQIHELRAFSCKCCSWNVTERIMYETVNEDRQLFCAKFERTSGWQLTNSLETLTLVFNVSSEDQGCHAGDLSVTVECIMPAWLIWLRHYGTSLKLLNI